MIEEAFVLLDANVLVDFPPLDQIDWRMLCDAQRVRLVVYPLLRREISQLKDNPRMRLQRERIRSRETWLQQALPGTELEVRSNVLLCRDTHEPRDLIEELGLDRTVNDSILVATAVSYQRAGRAVFVASSDGGVQMRLEDFQVPWILPPDHLRLAPEPDPQRQRADRLDAELRVLKGRLPDLRLNANPPLVRRQMGLGDLDTYVEQGLRNTETGYQDYLARQGQRGVDSLFRGREQELTMLRHFLRAQHEWGTRSENAIAFRVTIENVGSLTATDLRVRFDAPAALQIHTTAAFGNQPTLNSPLGGFFVGMPRLHLSNSLNDHVGLPSEGRSVRHGSGIEVHWSRLMQRDQTMTQKILVTAPKGFEDTCIPVRYQILCEERPGSQDGFFPVSVV